MDDETCSGAGDISFRAADAWAAAARAWRISGSPSFADKCDGYAKEFEYWGIRRVAAACNVIDHWWSK